MRLLLTVVEPARDRAGRRSPSVRDLAVDLADDATLAGLVAATGLDVEHGLWLGDHRLDLGGALRESRVRSGAVLGVGAPVPAVLEEPDGVVDVLVVSGPGAGRVHRLRAGSARVGGDPGADVHVQTGHADVAVRLDVGTDGRVTVTATTGGGATRPAPARRRPLPGPFVVPDGPAPRRRGRRAAAGGTPLPAAVGGSPPAAAVTTVAPDADVPLVHLDRRAVTTTTPWPPGTPLVVGDTTLGLALPQPPDAVLTPGPRGATVDVNRPPRLLPPPRVSEFALPAAPVRADKQAIPWLLVLAPLAMSLGLYWFTRSPYTLAFALMSPLMAIGNVTSSRRQNTLRHRRQVREHATRTAAVRAAAYAALLTERAERHHDAPDPATVLLTAIGPRTRLWERRRRDPDWLRVRLGTSDQPSEVVLRDPAREEHEGPLRWSAADVPVTVDLAAAGVLGIAGPAPRRHALGSLCLAQAAVLSSPTDLEVVLLCAPRPPGPHTDPGHTDPGHTDPERWDWVRWLPHARRDEAPVGAAVAAGTDEATLSARLAELTELLAARTALLADRRTAAAPAWRDVLVVLDGARRLRALPGVVSLLQDGPAVGIRLVCLDEDVRSLPEECRAVADATAVPGSLGVDGEELVECVRFDEVGRSWCERLGRALAPLRDSSSEDLAGNLPGSSRLLEVLGLDAPGDLLPGLLATRWRGGGRTTRATIGESVEGPHVVDLRADGPHGLVAGTTGSGKSELLQTIIASLAVGNRPDEFTFVLIDYKGGAAFEDCRDLPHTVGMVTDLDGHLTSRALASLGAELKHREHVLAAAGAKDLEDYTAARDVPGAGLEPLPRLLIVIDEFAALVAELPGFVTGLVDIARRGRSLGVHLLLATQRPAGVVSAEIRSNTALRIALRVTDAQDSQDVLDTGDAAGIPRTLPGRAFARSGTSALVGFQAARVGGRAGASTGSAVAELSLGPAPAAPGLDAPAREVEDAGPTDLSRLVAALRTAADDLGVPPPRSPWLPALPETVVLPAGCVERGRVPALPLGVEDLPRLQRRAGAVLDLTSGSHLAVVGAPRSGRSSVLRAVAGAVARTCHPADVHLYGVDCGSSALLPLTSLPHTGAVVTRDQVDRISRLTERLSGEIGRRQRLLADAGFSCVAEQRDGVAEEDRLPHLVVLFDRWEGFVAAFESLDGGRLVDAWVQVLAEGGAMGITVVLSVDRTGLLGRVSTLLDDKLVLRMTDAGDFSGIGLPASSVPAGMPPGRGFRAGPGSEVPVETQVALLDEDASGTAQVAALQTCGKELTARHADLPPRFRPFRVDVLPTRVDLVRARREFPGEVPGVGGPHRLAVAVGGDTLGLRHLDLLEDGPGILVAGPRRSGRSTALLVLAEQALAAGLRVGIVVPRRSPLRGLADRPGVVATLPADADRDAVTSAFAALAPGEGLAPSLLLVDDLEVLGMDGPVPDAVAAHLETLRDSGCAVVGAGSLEDLASMYRGPVVALKRQRTGLLLTPRSANDGDLFGLRLSRSVLGGGPGRGMLVRAGSGESVQVLEP